MPRVVALLLAGASLVLLAGAQAPSQSSSEALTVASLASGLADTMAEFRNTVVRDAANQAKQLVENLGLQSVVESVVDTVAVFDKLKDDAVAGVDGVVDMFADDTALATYERELESFLDASRPVIRALSGECDAATATAQRRALLQEAEQNRNVRRRVSKQLAGPLPIFGVSLSFSATYTKFRHKSVRFEPTVDLGSTIAVDMRGGTPPALGVAVGLALSVSYEPPEPTPAPPTPAPPTPAPPTPAPPTPAPPTPAPPTPAPPTPAPPTACTTDADCGVKEECKGGQCVPLSGSVGREAEVLTTGAGTGAGTGSQTLTKSKKNKVLSKIRLEVSIAVEFTTEDVTPFVFGVEVLIPTFFAEKLPIDSFTVMFTHPHWKCLEVISGAEWASNAEFAGIGLSLTSLTLPLTKAQRDTNFWKAYDEASGGFAKKLKGFLSKWGALRIEAFLKTKGNKLEGGGIALGASVALGDTGEPGAFQFDPEDCPGAEEEPVVTATATLADENAVTTSSEGQTSGRTGRALLSTTDDIVAFLKRVKPILEKGEITAPFCLGNCDEETRTAKTSISGTGRVGLPKTCDGVEASVWVDELTMANVAYVVMHSFDPNAADALNTILGPVLSLGVQDAKLALSLTASGVELSAVGLPRLPDAMEGGFLTVVKDQAKNFRVSVSAELQFSGSVVLDLRVGTEPDLEEKNFAVVNVAGTLGMSIYSTFSYGSSTGPKQALGVHVPLKVCVENCDAAYATRRFLYLKGDLSLQLTKTAQLVNGELTMDGWWYRAFGVPFLHIGEVILGAGWDLKAPTGIPSKFTLGGAVCLGKEQNCKDKQQPYIEARTYVGVSTTLPEDNFFIGMVSELTVGGIIGVVADFAPGLDKVAIPQKLAESGLYPFDKNYKSNPNCVGAVDESQVPTEVDKDCYAFLSFSPLKRHQLKFRSGDVVIPQGVAFQGRLNFLGWEIAIDLAITKKSFYLNVEMDPVDLRIGAFRLRIGNKLNENNEAVGGARLLVDIRAPPNPSALVNVKGAFDIPMLKSYGYLDVRLNKDIFSFAAGIHLFGGALSSHVNVTWNWDLTYFEMKLEDMNFLYIVHIQQVLFKYDATVAVPYALFKCNIRVLFIFLEAEVKVQDNVITFELTLDLAFVATTVSGRAVVASDFKKSKFDISVRVGLGKVGQAIVDGINKAVKAVAKALTDAWNFVKRKMEELWNTIKKAFDEVLNAIKTAVTEFLRSLAEVLKNVVEALKKVPILGDLIKIGEKLFSGDFLGAAQAFGSMLGMFYKEGHRVVDAGKVNKYGCRLQVELWRECWCHLFCFFGRTCHDKRGEEFADPDCMERVALKAAEVKENTDDIAEKDEVVKKSQKANPGLEAVDAGVEVPMPTLDESTVSVPYGMKPEKARSGVSGAVRQFGGEGTDGALSAAEEKVALADMPFDLSSEEKYEQSVKAAQKKMTDTMADKAMEKQERMGEDMKSEAKTVRRAKPVLGKATSYTFRCDQDINLESLKPEPVSIDPACKVGARVVMVKKNEVPASNFLDRVCGTTVTEIVWELRDSKKCGGQSEKVVQTITRTGATLGFAYFPPDAHITTQDSLDPLALGVANVSSPCRQESDLFWEDSAPAPVEGECGKWVIERKWKIAAFFQKCNGRRPANVTRVQRIHVSDKTAPAFTQTPEAVVVVPFFENFRVETSIPLTEERTHPNFTGKGMVAYPTTTTSVDGPLELQPTAAADEGTCRERGLAQFTRTWTTTDSCGNSRTFSQTVKVQHPPAASTSSLRTTQQWDAAARLFAYAPGVGQLADACHAGKEVVGGEKRFVPLDNNGNNTNTPGATVDCGVATPWTEDGCRRIVPVADTTTTTRVHSVPPAFDTFPADVTVDTTESLDHKTNPRLGAATGRAFCGTPFTVAFRDAAPELVSCGVWTIARTWKVQPHYADCGTDFDAYPDSLTTTRVQVITVRDVFPPQFTQTPQAEVEVPFLTDYGTSVTGVPQVEDVAAHPDMAALGLVSYPVRLVYADVATEFHAGTARACSEGLAAVTREWTARDRCGTAATWSQVVRVRHPRTTKTTTTTAEGRKNLLGKATALQAFSVGEVQLDSTRVTGSVGSVRKVQQLSGVAVRKSRTVWEQEEGEVARSITAFSETLLDLPPLRTGPMAISCPSPGQTKCVVDTATPRATATATVHSRTNDLLLEGDGGLYNVFSLQSDQWLVQTPRARDQRRWNAATRQWVHERVTDPKPTATVRAAGWVIVNVRYTNLERRELDTLRDTVFEGGARGASFTLYNMKQLCGDRRNRQCRSVAGGGWKGFHDQHLLLKGVDLKGTLVTQDERVFVELQDSQVHGQLVSAGQRLRVDDTTFHGGVFPVNSWCP